TGPTGFHSGRSEIRVRHGGGATSGARSGGRGHRREGSLQVVELGPFAVRPGRRLIQPGATRRNLLDSVRQGHQPITCAPRTPPSPAGTLIRARRSEPSGGVIEGGPAGAPGAPGGPPGAIPSGPIPGIICPRPVSTI